jgi:hypothetical protein
MSATTFRVRRGDVACAHAGGIIEALRKGETVAGTAYADDYRRLNGGVDRVLDAIDALVRAELPAVQCAHLRWARGERLWVWSLGEPEGVAYFPQQEPETGVGMFPRQELGSRVVQWQATTGPSRGRPVRHGPATGRSRT